MHKKQFKKLKIPKHRSLSSEAIERFQKEVRAFYRKHGRSFPWRETEDPYRILVSEFMLQQTQTERVIPKYTTFLKSFPTIQRLKKSSLHSVLTSWSGLGYNRRAKFLWQTAIQIVDNYNEKLPSDIESLKRLPGIGEYTANALRAFVYDKPALCIETNIRTVFLYYFFKSRSNVSDNEIREVISTTLPKKNIRKWYYALMDMGVALKAQRTGIDKKSKHYKRQSAFKGSNREVRGTILKMLIEKNTIDINDLKKLFPKKLQTLDKIIAALIEEELIERNGKLIVPRGTH